ncbi:hypothetical protein TPCV2_22460 [Cutibacterium avidum]
MVASVVLEENVLVGVEDDGLDRRRSDVKPHSEILVGQWDRIAMICVHAPHFITVEITSQPPGSPFPEDFLRSTVVACLSGVSHSALERPAVVLVARPGQREHRFWQLPGLSSWREIFSR